MTFTKTLRATCVAALGRLPVAFMEKLPSMSEEDYGKLVMASMAVGGHNMHGGQDMGMSMGAGPPADATARVPAQQAR